MSSSGSGNEDIAVIISAQIGELQAGLKEATDSIKEFSSNIKDGMEKGGESADGFSEKLGLALEGGIFLEFEEIAKQALEVVEQAFEKTAQAAEEFGIQNAKFAAIMGTSTQDAAGLDGALKSVGISLKEYEGLALRMEMRLKTQEQAFTNLGMATRDHNGDLLQGEALMNSAIATMETYKTGTDQNEFSLQIFGRRAQEVYDIMRVGKIDQQQYIQDMKDLGVNTADTAQSSIEMEAAIGRQKQQWEDVGIAIGQKVMPVITEFFNWMNNDGKPILNAIGNAVKFVIEEFVWLATTIDEVALAVALPLADMTEAVIGFAKVVYDVFTLNWGSIAADVKTSWDGMRDNWKQMLAGMKADADAYQKTFDALYGNKPKPEDNPFNKGGTKHFPQQQTIKKDTSAETEQLDNQRIKSAEALTLARIKGEQDADTAILALGKETAEEYYKNEVGFEEQSYAAKKQALEQRLTVEATAAAAHRSNLEQNLAVENTSDTATVTSRQAALDAIAKADATYKLTKQKTLDDLHQLEVTHSNTLDKLYATELERKQQLARQELQSELQDDNSRLTNAMAVINEEYKLYQLSDTERAAAAKNVTTTIYGEELARLDAEMATLTKGTKAWNEAYKERAKIAQDMAKAIQKIDNDLNNFEQQKWDQLGNSIKSSFNSSLNGMLLGTTSWQNALLQVVDSIANAFLNMGEKILEDWITTQIAKEAISKTTESTSAVSQITAAAGVAAANTFASIAAIPIIGPELAPGAAAVSMSTVLGFNSLAFAEQGMLLDRDRLVFAHKDEQILPAHLSKGLQRLINGGSAGSGEAHLHYSPTINSPQAQSLGQLLDSESRTMLSWVKARVRDGSLKVS